jgi:D-alanyl-lipoteichoic acid acyltransferase DltB (MBOAT superfamily)
LSFTSPTYYLAFLAFLLVFQSFQQLCLRQLLLLAGSYAFYLAFDWRFGILLLSQTAICFLAGKCVEANRSKRLSWLWGCCLFSLGILGFFKYYNFFAESFSQLLQILHLPYLVPHLNILLPVGISFFTFQSLGYVFDVYRGKIEAERDFAVFALFVAFFPQLAAGPIGRAGELLPQLRTLEKPSSEKVYNGLRQIIWGLFKKVVVADRLAFYVDIAFDHPETSSSATLLLASCFFSLQIYCDFSGYSDIAIGSARLLGVELRKNFDFPYFATSIGEFWKKWHISLTSWFRDYLYIPLGGNRCSKLRWMLNIMAIFLASGLWHGANWTFLVWGGLHGMLYLVEIALRGKKPIACNILSRLGYWLLTMALVTLAWIFFRTPSFTVAWQIITGIVNWHGRLSFGPSQLTFLLDVLAMLVFGIVEWGMFKQKSVNVWLQALGYSGLLVLISLLGMTSESFIYLQF